MELCLRQGVETVVKTGCKREGRLWQAEKDFCSLFENVYVLFCPLSQRLDTWTLYLAREEPKTHFPLHPALSGVARGTLEAACGVVQW